MACHGAVLDAVGRDEAGASADGCATPAVDAASLRSLSAGQGSWLGGRAALDGMNINIQLQSGGLLGVVYKHFTEQWGADMAVHCSIGDPLYSNARTSAAWWRHMCHAVAANPADERMDHRAAPTLPSSFSHTHRTCCHSTHANARAPQSHLALCCECRFSLRPRSTAGQEPRAASHAATTRDVPTPWASCHKPPWPS